MWLNDRSSFFLVIMLAVLVDLVHERIVLAVHHGPVGVDGHVFEVDCQHHLLLHDDLGGVIGQFDVEEASIGFGEGLVLVLLVVDHGFYHEADVVLLEFLAVGVTGPSRI